MSLAEIGELLDGTLIGQDVSFENVSIDTRTIQPGDLFIAIKGPNFNGNQFAQRAQEEKACAVMVSEPMKLEIPSLLVSDTRLALGKIGSFNRELSDACVLGLTGSQGKTTVKEMTASILRNCGKTMSTTGNLNNDFGVPLTLLNIGKDHQFAVIEMGANAPGEIAYTAGLTKPDIVHITNIAPTHLEGFGSIDGVNQAKSEIWKYLKNNGCAIINLDDRFASDWEQELSGSRYVTVSANGNKRADYRVLNPEIQSDLTSSFILLTPVGELQIRLPLPGIHNIANAAAAAAMAMEAGAGVRSVVAGLESMQAVKGRMQSKKAINGMTIIDDSYNASPSSFKAAIDVLAEMPGTRIIAMGDMGELGESAEQEHREIGFYARQKGINLFYSVGPLSQIASSEFGEGSCHFDRLEQIREKLFSTSNSNTVLMVKGSRSAGMDKLVAALLAEED